MSFLDCCFSSLSARSPMASGEWLVKRELEKGLTWPHSPDLSSTCSGTTPTSNMEMEKITKHFTDRYLTCQPSLESLLSPPAQAPVPWVTSRKTREHPCPECTTALGATGRDPAHHLPYLQPSLAPAIPTASLQIPPPPCHRAGL